MSSTNNLKRMRISLARLEKILIYFSYSMSNDQGVMLKNGWSLTPFLRELINDINYPLINKSKQIIC